MIIFLQLSFERVPNSAKRHDFFISQTAFNRDSNVKHKNRLDLFDPFERLSKVPHMVLEGSRDDDKLG